MITWIKKNYFNKYFEINTILTIFLLKRIILDLKSWGWIHFYPFPKHSIIIKNWLNLYPHVP